MRKKGVAVVTQPEQRAAQAALMVAHRLTGKTIGEIQETFGCSRSKVHRMLRHATREELWQQAHATILEQLLPKALAVYDRALDKGNVEVAHDVLFGLGVLQKNPRPLPEADGSAEPEETFEVWRARILRRRELPGTGVTHG